MSAARGSEKLLAAWRVKPAAIDETFIKGLVASFDGLELLGWHTKGQPGPDVLRADLRLEDDDVGQCGNVVVNILRQLSQHPSAGHVIVHPIGVPQLDGFRITAAVDVHELMG